MKQNSNSIYLRLFRDKSVFKKYFITCTAIMLSCFLFLGTVLIIFSVNYSNDQRQSTNFNCARAIKNLYTNILTNNFIPSSDQGMSAILDYSQQLTSLIGEVDSYIVDSKGNVLGHSQQSFTRTVLNRVPQSIMDSFSKGKKEYREIGTLGGFFDSSYNTVGVPIVVENQIVGAVFVSSRANNLLKYMYDMFRMFLLCIFISLVFSFVIIYFVTAKMVKPLRDMSRAAKSFSKGDFSIRVPVEDKDEIGQLAVAFNNMATSLTSLEEMRRSFVANVSHELKTPMTSIAGFIDGILDGTIPENKQEYYLTIVSNEVKRLSRLVRSFLDIASIESGEIKINPSEFDVAETVRRVIVGFEYTINEKKLDIRGLDSDWQFKVVSDSDLTYQIVYNLVENAIKFANENGYIEIKLAEKNKKVYISVKNSGMGIPQGELPYIFDRFYKTDKSRSLDRKGVGLGLYIVKSVLNLQGQDILVKSVEGEYCEFVFTLAKA
ncbi:MAG TPA: HAMP domain-containing sensor histidine kinase [Clostridia bacterium]|nr:HAMP domain-containing sensor histidine kinase [Clostridia bacterium]